METCRRPRVRTAPHLPPWTALRLLGSPKQSGAPPQQLQGPPWPRQLASGRSTRQGRRTLHHHRKGLFLVEITFLSNLIAWAYLRLFIYPVRCVYYGVWYGAREVVEWHVASGFQHPDLGPVPAERLMVKNGRVGKPLWTIGQGDFDIWEDMRLNPTNQYLKLYWTTGSLLTVLFIMHIIWRARAATRPQHAARPHTAQGNEASGAAPPTRAGTSCSGASCTAC